MESSFEKEIRERRELQKAVFGDNLRPDNEIVRESFLKCLESSYDSEDFLKSWSGDLQKRFPNGGWRTINGARVFINGGKVIAGLGGFNQEIDKFFENKKKEGEGNKPKLTKEEIGSANLKHRSNVIKEKYDLTKEESNTFLQTASRVAWSKAKKEGDGVDMKISKDEADSLVKKGLLFKKDNKYYLTDLGKKEADWRENVSETELESKSPNKPEVKKEEGKDKPVNERSTQEISEAKQKIADTMPKPIHKMTWEEFKPYGIEMQKQSSHSQPDSFYERQAKYEHDWAIKNNKSQYDTSQQDKGESKFTDLQDKLDYYNSLTPKEKQKYRADTVDFVMDIKTRLDNSKDDKVKKVFQTQLDFSNKLLEEIGKIKEPESKPIAKQSDKEFLAGDWKYGGTRSEVVEAWTKQAKDAVGKGKKFKTIEEAKNEINKMAKNVKEIDEERYRVLKMVESNL